MYRNVAVEVVRSADFIGELSHQIQQLWNEQFRSLAVLPDSSSSSAPKAKSWGGKRSNLTARNDGREKENRRFGKDLGTEKITKPISALSCSLHTGELNEAAVKFETYNGGNPTVNRLLGFKYSKFQGEGAHETQRERDSE